MDGQEVKQRSEVHVRGKRTRIDQQGHNPRRGALTIVSEMLQLLALHHQYGHIPMRKLQEMAKQGILPRRLAICGIPTCSACLFAKANKGPWRGKTRKSADDTKSATATGDVVSADQLESPTPGLITQMTGTLTTKRYKYATANVDQRSRFGYVHLQRLRRRKKRSKERTPSRSTQGNIA
jgi:hypothetical protein